MRKRGEKREKIVIGQLHVRQRFGGGITTWNWSDLTEPYLSTQPRSVTCNRDRLMTQDNSVESYK